MHVNNDTETTLPCGSYWMFFHGFRSYLNKLARGQSGTAGLGYGWTLVSILGYNIFQTRFGGEVRRPNLVPPIRWVDTQILALLMESLCGSKRVVSELWNHK